MTNAFERIAAIIDSAAPPVPPVIEPPAAAAPAGARTARTETTSDGEAGRPIVLPPPADVAADDGPPPAPPPAGADEINASSQMGATAADQFDGGEREGAQRSRRAKAAGKGNPDALDLELAFKPHTDLGNVERFVQRQRDRLRYNPALGWFYWDRKRWCRDGADEVVRRACHETVRKIQDEALALAQSDYEGVAKVSNEGKANEVTLMHSDILSMWGRTSENKNKMLLADDAAPYLYVESDALDADPFLINVLNGTLMIRRDLPGYVKFKPHDPADLITKLMPVTYDPEAVCPIYDAFLADVQPKPENIRFLHAWGGYSLTADASEQKLVFLWGKGKNGKSTLVDAWGHIAGDYGKSVPIETFVNEGRGRNAGAATPDLAMLHSVRALRSSEPERGAKLAEALIKLVTGGEPMSVRHLNRDYFMLRPVFKLTISGNYRPTIQGADEGIWRRVVLVPFLVTVDAAKLDRGLGEKLRREASGILNRLLDGLRDWLDHGLQPPDDVVKATADYRSDSDPLGRMLDACTVREAGARTQASTFHEVFIAWARANGATEWSARGLAFAMKERGFESLHANVNWWLNVKLIKSASDFVDEHGRPIKEDRASPAGGRDGGSDDIGF